MIALEIIVTPLLARTQPPYFIDGQRLLIGVAMDQLRPAALAAASGGGGDELDETEVAQVSNAPARHGRHGRAEHRIIRVIADPGQRPDQHVESLGRQALHLAQGANFQPRPPAHEAGRYMRTASSSGIRATSPAARVAASRRFAALAIQAFRASPEAAALPPMPVLAVLSTTGLTGGSPTA